MKNPLRDNFVLAGVLLIVLQSLFFSVMGLFIKLASEHHHTIDVVFYRNVISMALVFALLAATGKLDVLRKVNVKRQFTRGTIGTVAMILTFATFAVLPLSEAQSLFFTAPLFVVALSWPLLKEKVGPYRAIATIVGFGGVLLILQPGTISSVPGALMGLGAAFGHASVMLCLRWLGRTENPVATIFYFSLVSTIWILPAMPFVWKVPTGETLLYLFAIGALAALLQYCLTKAYTLAPAAVLAPVTYLNLLWATLIDVTIYGYIPPLVLYVGAFIVIASNLFILYREQKIKKRTLSRPPS